MYGGRQPAGGATIRGGGWYCTSAGSGCSGGLDPVEETSVLASTRARCGAAPRALAPARPGGSGCPAVKRRAGIERRGGCGRGWRSVGLGSAFSTGSDGAGPAGGASSTSGGSGLRHCASSNCASSGCTPRRYLTPLALIVRYARISRAAAIVAARGERAVSIQVRESLGGEGTVS